MNGDDPNVRSIFCEALDRPSAQEREAYLDAACGGNARTACDALRRSCWRTTKPAAFSQETQPASFGRYSDPARLLPKVSGTVIGPYKLLEQIGEGGFGIVYMADQQAPVRRRVALKIIKPGMDTKQVLARFEAELQALALMDHPNIARVLDAGATDSGRPYFVMELVRGVPITDYCDQNNLAVHERLDLFVQVCHAVQHAHQKGIIHRDIKPSNVLVTMHDGRPVPKVIDFGVAKAINQQLTQETIFTRFAEMIGTPLYMSPEQAEMTSLDIDTRSDIYSLGVLLYELLTGTTPFEKERLKQAAFDEIRRIIREEEPAKPSTRISTLGDNSAAVAAHRHADPHRLGQLMRGDLDWIVMKALEKDRTRRYETANGLAMDLQRHLADEPVLAGPPSAAYRFRKFARRNRAALAMAAVVTVALLLGIVGTTWQAIRAKSERDRAVADRAAEADQRREAEANFQKARAAVDEYFTLVSESKLLDVPGLQPLRKDLLEAALRFYEKFAVERTDDPGVLADLAVTHLRVAEVYLTFGRTDDTLASLAKALDVIDRLRRDYPAATEQRRRLAGYWKGSRTAQKADPSAPSDGLAALKLIERQVDTWQRLADENPTEIGFQSDLAAIYAHLGQLLDYERPADAAIFSEKSAQILEKLVRDHPKVPEYRADLARVYETLIGTFGRLGRSADSESAFHRSLEINEQLAADFPNVPQYRVDLAMNLKQLGVRLKEKGDPEHAVAAHRRATDLMKGLVTDFPAVPLYRSLLTSIANDLLTLAKEPGQHQQEAEKLYRELMANVTQLAAENPEQHDQYWQSVTASNYMDLAKLFQKGGQPKEAEKVIRQGIGILEKLVTDRPNDRISRNSLAECYQILGTANLADGRNEEACKAYRHAADLTVKLTEDFPGVPEYRDRRAHSLHQLAVSMPSTGQAQEKANAYREAVQIFAQLVTDYPKNLEYQLQLAHCHHELGATLKSAGGLAEAEQEYRQAVALKEKVVAESPANPNYRFHLAISHLGLAYLLNDIGRKADAEAAYRDALALWEKLVADSPSNADYRWNLAGNREAIARLLSETGRKADAETAYRDALALWEKLVAESPTNIDYRWHLAVTHDVIGNLLKDAGRFQDATEAYRHALPLWEKLSADTNSDDHRMHLSWTRGWLVESLVGRAKQLESGAKPSEAARKSADQAYRDAIAVWEKAAADDPKNEHARAELSHTLRQVADAWAASDRRDDAESAYRRALSIVEKLAADFPKNLDYQLQLANCHNDFATTLKGAGRVAEAEQHYRQALALKEKLVADAPANPDYRFHLAHSHLGLAYLLSETKQSQEAEKNYRQALALFEKAVADSPSKDYYRSDLGHTMWQLGDFLSAVKRPGEAEPTYREALAVFEKLAVDFPENKFWIFEQGFNHWKIGDLMRDLGRLPHAEESYRKALTVYAKLSADFPNDAEHRSRLARSHVLLIDVLLPQNKHAEAAKLAVELARISPDNSESLRTAAYLEKCAALAQKDESLPPPKRKSVADGYATLAEELRREVRERNNPGPRPKPANEAGTTPQQTPTPETKQEDNPAK